MKPLKSWQNLLCLHLNNFSGQTMVEILVAGGILSVALLGSTGAVYDLTKAKRQSELVSHLIALESSLAAAFADPSQYSEDQKQRLREGQVPSDLSLSLQIPSSAQDRISISVGQPKIFLSRNLLSCTDFPSEDCVYAVEFQIQNRANLSASSGGFGVAYQISLQAEESLPLSLGAEAPFDKLEDYLIDIPSSVYHRREESGCAADEVFVTGLDRATGSVICVKKPSVDCADNQVVTGLQVDGLDLNLKCQDIQVDVSCPQKHSLQSVALNGYTLQAQCIYGGEENGTSSADSLAGNAVGSATIEACPEDYTVPATSTCQFQTLQKTNGSCPYISGWAPNENRTPGVSHGGEICTRVITTWSPVSSNFTIDPENYVAVTSQPQGRNISCTLRDPVDRCGSSWQGRLTYTPSCRLDLEYRPSQPAVVE